MLHNVISLNEASQKSCGLTFQLFAFKHSIHAASCVLLSFHIVCRTLKKKQTEPIHWGNISHQGTLLCLHPNKRIYSELLGCFLPLSFQWKWVIWMSHVKTVIVSGLKSENCPTICLQNADKHQVWRLKLKPYSSLFVYNNCL